MSDTDRPASLYDARVAACAQHGHQWELVFAAGDDYPKAVVCARLCGVPAGHVVRPDELTEARS